MSGSHEIARGVTGETFLKYDLSDRESPDWDKEISVFEKRFKNRFFVPLEKLKGKTASDDTNGFIVLTCSFALIETLGGFREGKTEHNGKSKQLFKSGLSGLNISNLAGETEPASDLQKNDLYAKGRCALLHTGGTDNIKVCISGPAVKLISGGFEINRDEFLIWVESRFTEYASKLRNPRDPSVRDRFITKMAHIARN